LRRGGGQKTRLFGPETWPTLSGTLKNPMVDTFFFRETKPRSQSYDSLPKKISSVKVRSFFSVFAIVSFIFGTFYFFLIFRWGFPVAAPLPPSADPPTLAPTRAGGFGCGAPTPRGANLPVWKRLGPH
jgi:hypothetical protein